MTDRSEKFFNKIQYSSLIKISSKLEIEGYFLNVIKGIYEKPTATTILKAKRPKVFTIRMEKGNYFFSYPPI